MLNAWGLYSVDFISVPKDEKSKHLKEGWKESPEECYENKGGTGRSSAKKGGDSV